MDDFFEEDELTPEELDDLMRSIKSDEENERVEYEEYEAFQEKLMNSNRLPGRINKRAVLAQFVLFINENGMCWNNIKHN